MLIPNFLLNFASELKRKSMNKKVIIIICAVLAFFAGAIWVSEVPTVATLVAFLECAAGFACGFFFNRELTNGEKESLNEELKSLKAAQKAVLEEKKEKTVTKRSTKASKE